jgi:hypothetical protein
MLEYHNKTSMKMQQGGKRRRQRTGETPNVPTKK